MFSFLKRLDRAQRTQLYACFFSFFCSGLVTLTVGSAMPDLRAAYGLSDALGGLLLACYPTGNLVAGFTSGIIPLYLGRRKSIMLLSALLSVGMTLLTLWGEPAFLFFAFLTVGLGRGSITNFNTRTVNVLTDGSPTASNLLHALFALGAITAPMAFLLWSRGVSWRAALLAVAACCCLCVIFFGRMRGADDRPAARDKSAKTLSFLREPAFLTHVGMMFFYLCSEYAVNGWLVTYIQHKDSLRAALNDVTAYSQTMATLLWAVILAGRLLCAWLSRRRPQKKLMFLFSLGMAGCFTGMLLARTGTAVSLSVAGLGFCMAGICPMIYSDAVYYTNSYPLATGALLALGSLGGVLMPLLVGLLAGRFGFGGGMGAILAAIALLILFSAVNLRMRPKGQG